VVSERTLRISLRPPFLVDKNFNKSGKPISYPCRLWEMIDRVKKILRAVTGSLISSAAGNVAMCLSVVRCGGKKNAQCDDCQVS
jgi:hypothetical protein